MPRHLLSARRSRTMTNDCRQERGSVAIITAVSFIPIALILAVVIDAGRSWVGLERLQNGVEAAATSAAQTWMKGGSGCEAQSLALASRNGANPVDLQCVTSGTASRGVVQVSAAEDIHPMFSKILGRSTVRVRAKTGVKIGPANEAGGLRPFSLCADNVDIKNWINGGMQANVTVFITFQATNVLCGGNVSGNWSILDYNGGSNSNSETQGWVNSGYNSIVRVGDLISGNPGVPSSSLNLTAMVGQHLIIPMFREPTGTGSTAIYKIVGFAQVYLVSVKVTGASSQRGFTVRFEQGTLSGQVGSGSGTGFGLSAWSVCSFDTYGNCS